MPKQTKEVTKLQNVKTNIIDYTINYTSFWNENDILLISFTSDKELRNSKILSNNITIPGIKASVISANGDKLFILLNKNSLKRTEIPNILSNYPTATWTLNPQNTSTCNKKHENFDIIILQLLLNEIHSSNDDVKECNTFNHEGRFFLLKQNWITKKQVHCLEFRFKENTLGCILKANVKTFSEKQSVIKYIKNTLKKEKQNEKIARYNNLPHYYLDKEHNKLIKTNTKNTDEEYVYIQRQNKNERYNIDFLKFDKAKNFYSSKAGIISELVNTFNILYEGICHIEFKTAPVSNFIDITSEDKNQNINARNKELNNKTIHVINLTNDVVGEKYFKQFINDFNLYINYCTDTYFKNLNVKMVESQKIIPGEFNICIIHEKEYYKDIPDVYQKHSNTIIQHITTENIASNCSSLINKDKIPNDLKNIPDIEDKNTSMINKAIYKALINQLWIKQDIINKKITIFNWANLNFKKDIIFGKLYSQNKENRYFFIIISPDGDISFKEEKDKPEELFNLFMNSDNNSNNSSENISNKYIEALDLPAKKYEESTKFCIGLDDGSLLFVSDTGVITLPESEKIGEILSNPIKGHTMPSKSAESAATELGSIFGICSFKFNDSYFYYVGEPRKEIQKGTARAAAIRQVERYSGNIESFNKLLKLMAVYFVRSERFTVLPFPIKYLNEYVEQKFYEEEHQH